MTEPETTPTILPDPQLRRVEIQTAGKRATVKLDGHDISSHISSVRVDVTARKWPTVSLDVTPTDGTLFQSDEAEVLAQVSEEDFKTKLVAWLQEQAEDETLEASVMEASLEADITTAWIDALIERARG